MIIVIMTIQYILMYLVQIIIFTRTPTYFIIKML